MDERTGGHYLDTGEGPVSVDAPETKPAEAAEPMTGRAEQTPHQQAWAAWLDHQKACAQCRTSVYKCATSEELWKAYRATR